MGQGYYLAVGYGWADDSFVERDEDGDPLNAKLDALMQGRHKGGLCGAYESDERWIGVPLLDMSGTFGGGADVSHRRTAFALSDLEAHIERLNPGGLALAKEICEQVQRLCPAAPPPYFLLMLDYD